MKNIHLIFFLFFSLQLSAQVPYTAFDFQNSEWEEEAYSLWFSKNFSTLNTAGDTLVNGIPYYKLRKKGHHYNYESHLQDIITDTIEYDYIVGLIRENEQKQIEFLDINHPDPLVLYDFNLQIGDTTNVYDFGNGNTGNAPVRAIVYGIDTVDICGTLRNQYQLFSFEMLVFDFIYLTEGIGSNYGLLPHLEIFESGGFHKCFSTLQCVCNELIVSTQSPDLSLTSLQVYPNPAQENFIIATASLKKNTSIEIFNIFGQQILSETLTSNEKNVSCKGWEKGTYFLKVSGTNWQQVHKILIL